MLWLPAARLRVLQAAVLTLPAPPNATAPQPLMVLPPSVKFTLPVGAVPVTDAVKVTPAATVEGFTALASEVVVAVPPLGAETESVSALAVAESTLTLIP